MDGKSQVPALSVVIPAYNEETRLGPTLEQIVDYCERDQGRYEVVVVDDGSSDSTVEVARSIEAPTGEIRVIELGVNRGKGAAVRTGMLAARGDQVLFSDADLATPIEEVAKLQAKLAEGYDVAIGSRAVDGADIRVRQHPIRELAGRTFNVLVRVLVMGGIKDTQCGFKLFTRDAATYLFTKAEMDGFVFDVEVLYLAKNKYRVAEVPVIWHHVEESRVSRMAGAQTFVDLARVRLKHWRS